MRKAATQASRSLYQGKTALPWWIKRVLANALQTDEGFINPKGYPELDDARTENVKLRVSTLFHKACVEAAKRSGCSLTEWILAQCLKAMDAQESDTRNDTRKKEDVTAKVPEIKILMKINEDVRSAIMEAGARYAERFFKERGGASEWVQTVLAQVLQEDRKVNAAQFPILEKRRTTTFDFRCTKAFRDACQKAAGGHGFHSVSTWIQAHLLQELDQAIMEKGIDNRDIKR
ncbi:MAG TPA: hypothetical protein VK465_19005 [Fibrobacteria bacterium]|nr:hypothetical protein [Fibrobacteria bacterium]